MAAERLAGAGRSGLAERVGRSGLVALVVGYLAVVLLAPLAALVVEAARLGLTPIAAALAAPAARDALARTLALVAIAVVVNAVVGTLGALAIVRHCLPGRVVIGALADLPLAISPVMIGLAVLLLVGRDGHFGPALARLGVDVAFAFPGLVVATLFVTLPYTLREVAYVLDARGASEEEAAATLGATRWQSFWRVTLPGVRRGLGHGLSMTAARALGEFGAVLVLGGGVAGHTATATTYVHAAFEERAFAGALGMAALLGLMSMGLVAALDAGRRRARGAG